MKYDCFVCVRLHVCSGCVEPRAFISHLFHALMHFDFITLILSAICAKRKLKFI